MPLGAIWNAITGMFSSRTLAEDYMRDYRRLIDDLSDAIRHINRERRDLRDARRNVRDTFRSYRSAQGEVATLYYEKVDENRDRFVSINDDLNEMLDELRTRQERAETILSELGIIHELETERELAYTHEEIRTRLNQRV